MLIVITLLLTVSFGFGTEEAAQDIGTVIAIDLGTTYSSVGIFRNGRVEIIPNDQGSHITPSYVAFTRDGERLIGDAAKNQLTSNPNNTIFDVKRLIGREFIDPLVQQAIKYYPFAIIERNGKPTIQINVGKAIKHFTPEEISAMILSKMREIAESYLGRKVTDAVVTVPGYFNTRQRQATQDAATIAGLNLLKMISKPNAAAIAYAFCKRDGEHNVLVLNLGGGTFDVSLLTIDNGVIEVVAINGDLCLGGEDFDRRVMEYFMKLFKLKTGKDVRKYDSAMQKLRREVERAKRILSSEHATKIEIESFFGNEDFRETLTRAKFDELNMDLFHATIKPIQKVLEDADLKKTDISEVVLVGGSTRIPKFQQLVKEFFDCKVLLRSMNPDQAAASGAAVFVGVTYGEESTGNIVLLDVYPFTVGFKTVDGLMAKIVPRNTVIPTKKSQIFSTTIDFQQSVKIQVFEGERPMAKDNHFLGEFDLTGISMASKGLWEIAVTIEIDTNHVLKVTAKDTATGKTNNSVMNSNPNRLSPEEIDRMIKASKQFSNRDKRVKERVGARSELECYVYSLKTQLTDTEKLGEKLSSQDKKKIEEVVEEQIAWIESNPGATVDELREHKKQWKDVVTLIVAELYENIDGSCSGNLFTGVPEYPMDCTPDHAHPPPRK